jgi:predicted amidophosphoribosyltransferase
MKFFLDTLIKHIECPLCLKCGSIWVQDNYFCAKCSRDFLQQHFGLIQNKINENLNVTSFIRWNKNQSNALSELVYLLKTRTSYFAWTKYVESFEDEICKLVDGKENTILIPVPGTRKSFHTSYFAKAVQSMTGCRAIFALNKPIDLGMQKTKSLSERRLIVINVNEDFTEQLLMADKVVLIDDILTTGATLNGCISALGDFYFKNGQSTKQVSALTLFYRPLE